jgi:hypothetical protein
MSGKKNVPTTTNPGLPVLRIGSRVRCTDDGVEGRIVRANGVSVKIRWDDGEQVTWRRDSLAGRPMEIIDAGDEVAGPRPVAATGLALTETETSPPTAEAAVPEPASRIAEPTAEPSVSEPVPPVAEPQAEAVAPASTAEAIPGSAEPRRRRPATVAPEKKVSALDAAARVLTEEGRPMNCREMIAAMAAKGYWTSPGGRTPAATLYSALLREVAAKGAGARFVKTERGKFARTTAG